MRNIDEPIDNVKVGGGCYMMPEKPPDWDFVGMPRLTVPMVARLQGFPDSWQFAGKKTIAYRQVGNVFPPPVARAVATQIKKALTANGTRIIRHLKRA